MIYSKPFANIQPVATNNSLRVKEGSVVKYDLFNDNGVLSSGYYPSVFERKYPTANFIPQMYQNLTRDALADELKTHFGFHEFYPGGGGSESNDLAIKIMRRWGNLNKRKTIYVYKGSFHGRGLGALSATFTHNRDGFDPLLPYFKEFEKPEQIGSDVAGIMMATVYGYHEWRPETQKFWDGISKVQRGAGCILTLDEIQCGSGRWGKYYAYPEWGIEPNMVTLGKGVAGGRAISYTLMDKMCAGVLGNFGHFSTYSGKIPELFDTTKIMYEIKWHHDVALEQFSKMESLFHPWKRINGKKNLVEIPITNAKMFSLILKQQGILVPVFRPDTIKFSWNSILTLINQSIQEYRNVYND